MIPSLLHEYITCGQRGALRGMEMGGMKTQLEVDSEYFKIYCLSAAYVARP